MKEVVLNSRLMCEYVKNKAALFALQDHSSRNMYNTKGIKVRHIVWKWKSCTVIHYIDNTHCCHVLHVKWCFVQEKQIVAKVSAHFMAKHISNGFQSNKKRQKRIIHFHCALRTFQSIQLIRRFEQTGPACISLKGPRL